MNTSFNQIAEKAFKEGTTPLVTALSLIYIIILLYYSLRVPFARQYLVVVFVMFSLTIYYLNELRKLSESEEISRVDAIVIPAMVVFSIIGTSYIFLEYEQLVTVRIGYATTADLVAGVLVLLPVCHATYRQYGVPFFSVLALALGYAYFGWLFPGMFNHSGFSLERIIQFTTVSMGGGVFGNINGVISTWVAIFVIFAGFLQGFGAMDWIRDIANKAGTYSRSGPAMAAVFSSMGFGMMSGSGAANTAITGAFTIPMMEDSQKLPPRVSAAIESVASLGGQIMPPVMGAAAFIMAEILGISLQRIILVAFIPAFIFFITLAVATHYYSLSFGEAAHIEGAETIQNLITRGYQYYLPLLLLLFLLIVLERGVLISGTYATLFALTLSGVTPVIEREVSVESARSILGDALDGIRQGMETTAKIGIIGAAIGIIVEVLVITAIAQRVAFVLLDLAGGSLMLLLLLTMVMAIILGMGAPPVAAYLVTALLLAPAIVEFGYPQIQAHFFVFYFAIVSMITPPIAIGCAIASNIADSKFIATTIEAMKIGFALYILPFTFFYHNLIPEDGALTAGLFIRGAVVLVGLSLLAYAGSNRLASTKRRLTAGAVGATVIIVWPILV